MKIAIDETELTLIEEPEFEFAPLVCERMYQYKEGLWRRCKDRRAYFCGYCSRLAARDYQVIAEDGLTKKEMAKHEYAAVTLTGPGFGPVHRAKGKRNKKCPCGEWHENDDKTIVGSPIELDDYDIEGQMRWQMASQRLLKNTLDLIAKTMGYPDRVIAKEYQKRMAVHYHIVFRWKKGNRPTEEELKDLLLGREVKAADNDVPQKWGTELKIDYFTKQFKSVEKLKKAIHYAVKYTTKGEDFFYAVDDDSDRAVFLAILEAEAKNVKCNAKCQIEDCRSRQHENFGTSTTFVRFSHKTKNMVGWAFSGLTRTLQQQKRAAYAAGFGEDVAGFLDHKSLVNLIEAKVELYKARHDLKFAKTNLVNYYDQSHGSCAWWALAEESDPETYTPCPCLLNELDIEG